jgi:hypothetical protein
MISLVSSGFVVGADQVVFHDGSVVAPLDDAGPLREGHDLKEELLFKILFFCFFNSPNLSYRNALRT